MRTHPGFSIPLALSLILISAGCRHFCPPATIQARPVEPVAQTVVQPPEAVQTPPSPESTEPTTPTVLEQADAWMAQRDYRRAAAVYREILREQSAGPDAPHAMLHLAIIQLVATGSLHDQAGAQNLLQRLVDKFPDSSERPTAEALLSLGNQADGLRRQLEELKRIDLGAGPSPTPR